MLGDTYDMALVCHCEAVSERSVRKAIRRGACSVEAVADLCGAGSRCTGCVPVVQELLDRYRSEAGVDVRLAS